MIVLKCFLIVINKVGEEVKGGEKDLNLSKDDHMEETVNNFERVLYIFRKHKLFEHEYSPTSLDGIYTISIQRFCMGNCYANFICEPLRETKDNL